MTKMYYSTEHLPLVIFTIPALESHRIFSTVEDAIIVSKSITLSLPSGTRNKRGLLEQGVILYVLINLHAVSCGEISVYDSFVGQVLHAFGHLDAYIQ